MRTLLRVFAFVALSAPPVLAQDPEVKGILDPNYGLMAWTLIIFIILFAILGWLAFPKILAAVEAREQALEDAIASAKRDREEAGRILAEHKTALDASRGEAQKIIVDARNAAERVRADLIEQAHAEQASILARARQEIESEKTKAIMALRKEAVDLAIAGASKVIEKNLDQPSNRQLVESFLASVSTANVSASR
ncbi:MAG: F0F1 ATP synthase subunit B [Gemmatimonadaceae bacterium]